MCNKSESIVNIAKALVAFSADVKPIEKDGTNPHFRSDYATLDNIIDVTKPLLQKHGLTVMQFPGGDGEKITVRTMILHNSGEWIESEPLTLKAVKTDPQGAGSAITYGRRYSYAAALSLSLGEDDDGNAASTPPRNSQQPTPINTPSRPSTPPTSQQEGVAMVTENQVKFIGSLKTKNKVPDDEYRQMLAPKTSTKDLTMAEAKKLINTLQDYVAQPVAAINDPDDLPF